MPYSKIDTFSSAFGGSYENVSDTSKKLVDLPNKEATNGSPKNENKMLANTIQQLPILFSNFHLFSNNTNHQFRHARTTKSQKEELCQSKSLGEDPSSTLKKRIVKKIMSFSSFDGAKAGATPKNRQLNKNSKSMSSTSSRDHSPSNSPSKSVDTLVARDNPFGSPNTSLKLSRRTCNVANTLDGHSHVVTTTTTIFEYNREQECASWGQSFFNFHSLFNSSSGRRNYKEKIKSMNVRRKSSLIQESCSRRQPKSKGSFLRLGRFARSSMEMDEDPSLLKNERLIDKAHKRGSIHYYSYWPYVVSTKELRQRLEVLAIQHRNFDIAANDFLSTRSIKSHKRKKAFDAMNLMYNDHFIDFVGDNFDSKKTCPKHMVSSLVSSGFVLLWSRLNFSACNACYLFCNKLRCINTGVIPHNSC